MSPGRTASRVKRQEAPVHNVWMLSHECAGIAQAGGLGEAVAGLSRTLAKDYGLNVTVFLPSHGRNHDPRLRDAYGFQEISTFVSSGHRTGVNGVSYPFLSGAEEGSLDHVRFVLIKGLDASTSRWLDDPVLYGGNLTLEKMALFSQTMKMYSEYLYSINKKSELPDLIHANDWHMIPAGVAIRQTFQERRLSVPLVFTIHLLSRVTLPWHFASEEWSGIKNLRARTEVGKESVSGLTPRQVWEEQCHESLEGFGCHEADYVTSVSKSYLAEDIFQYVGDVLRGRSGHIYNGCDWDFSEIKAKIGRTIEANLDLDRTALRNFLLTRALSPSELEGAPDQEASSPSSRKVGNLRTPNFEKDGPLVLMTGRLSPQKGVDLLLDAVPLVRRVIPTVRFLFFMLSSDDSSSNEEVETRADAYSDCVRVIFGRHPNLYEMSHVAADVYAMPSRSEPFGISALEAMATGNPVIGANVGGISETVLDIASHGEKGTGLLVPTDEVKTLADSLVALLLVMQINETPRLDDQDFLDIVKRIPVDSVRRLVSKDPLFGSKLRDNCIARVERDFRWKSAGETAIKRYRKAAVLAARLQS